MAGRLSLDTSVLIDLSGSERPSPASRSSPANQSSTTTSSPRRSVRRGRIMRDGRPSGLRSYFSLPWRYDPRKSSRGTPGSPVAGSIGTVIIRSPALKNSSPASRSPLSASPELRAGRVPRRPPTSRLQAGIEGEDLHSGSKLSLTTTDSSSRVKYIPRIVPPEARSKGM